MATRTEVDGYGWIVFAGIMLILVGAIDIVDGIRAISAQDTAFDAIFWDNNIEAWGWFYLVLGVIFVVAGVAVFNRDQWAVWVGIAAGSIAVVLNMFWVFVYPIHSLVVALLGVLVVYGLVVYGLDKERRVGS